MGVITAGSPLMSVVGIRLLTFLADKFGLNMYVIISGCLILLALLTVLFIKNTPEDAGLFPDGADHAPISESKSADESVTLKQILTDKRAWQLIISFGIIQFVTVAMMSYMAVRYIGLSTPNDVPNLFVSRAMFWLSIGAASGIPMSYVLGLIDDKLGSVKASLILNILFLFAVVPLAIMPVGGNTALIIIW